MVLKCYVRIIRSWEYERVFDRVLNTGGRDMVRLLPRGGVGPSSFSRPGSWRPYIPPFASSSRTRIW